MFEDIARATNGVVYICTKSQIPTVHKQLFQKALCCNNNNCPTLQVAAYIRNQMINSHKEQNLFTREGKRSETYTASVLIDRYISEIRILFMGAYSGSAITSIRNPNGRDIH